MEYRVMAGNACLHVNSSQLQRDHRIMKEEELLVPHRYLRAGFYGFHSLNTVFLFSDKTLTCNSGSDFLTQLKSEVWGE